MSKTILQIVQEVATVIGVDVPASVYGSTERELLELAQIANEMGARIAGDTGDWSVLKKLETITGDGIEESFALPSDYLRMLKTTQLRISSFLEQGLTHFPDTDDWLAMEQYVGNWVTGAWTIIGSDIHIRPIVASAVTVRYYYLDKNFALDTLGAIKSEFTVDTDTFRLDDRVLKLAIIWQWKAQKGFGYSEDMANYEEALAYKIGNDKGSNIISNPSRRPYINARYAYPGQLG